MKKILCLVLFLSSWNGYTAGNLLSGQQKSVTCAACHGPQGVSINPSWPNLAGQHATYLNKQLHDFKQADKRHADMMTPFVMPLSDEDMADLALFYAKQPLIAANKTAENTRGAQLYRVGDAAKQITACIACHGPKGTGNGEAGFPSLSGQQINYTVQQLQAFKDKTRKNDLNGIMRTISARMSAEDMMAVAEYLAQLPVLVHHPESRDAA